MADAVPVTAQKSAEELLHEASVRKELEAGMIPQAKTKHDDLKPIVADAAKSGRNVVVYPNFVRVDG